MKSLSVIARRVVSKRVRPKLSAFVHRAKSYWYAGSKRMCPFCGGRFRRMLDWGLDLPQLEDIIGGGVREAACPRCLSTDRERLVYIYLERRTQLFQRPSGFRLLHVAPELNLGRALRELRGLEYVPGDLEPLAGWRKLDITDLHDFPDGHFDGIICNHVLEHVPADEKGMSELCRVLDPAGWAILQVPMSRTRERTHEDPSIVAPEERLNAFGQEDHVRIYARSEYVERLTNSGFTVAQVQMLGGDLSPAEFDRLKLNPEEVLFVCTKA